MSEYGVKRGEGIGEAKEEKKEFTPKGVFECLSGVKKGLEMIKEACGNPGEVPYVVGGVCGLSKLDTVRIMDILESIQHAIDERDWDRLKAEIFQRALEELKKAAEIMTAAGCKCPPHGIFEPSEVAEGLQKFIKEENAEKALVCISRLCFSLLEDAVSK